MAAKRITAAVSRAAISVVEALEQRQMLAASTTQIAINFGPWGSEAAGGYFTDSGEAYGTQQFGFDYGWDTTISSGNTFRRDISEPAKRETGIITSTGNKWEIAIPNGTYVVKLVAGDGNITSGTYKYNVESVTNFINGTASSGSGRWVSATDNNLVVADGKLTIEDNGGTQHRLAYIEIVKKSDKDSATIGAPTNLVVSARHSTQVDVRWTDNANNEDFDNGYQIERTNTSTSAVTTINVDGGIRQYMPDWQGLSASTPYSYRIRAKRTDTSSSVAYSSWSSPVTITTPANNNQAAYGASNTQIAGTFQAEDFDRGVSGDAYSDVTPSNAGGFYRQGSIDVGWNVLTNDYFVGWIESGEWQEYTSNISTTGTYYAIAEVSSPGQGGTWKLAVNGTNKVTGVVVKDTGGFSNFQPQSTTTFSLTAASNAIVRFEATGEDATGTFVGNFDNFALHRFDAPTSGSATAVSSAQIDLTWTNNHTGSGWNQVWRQKSGGSWVHIATVPSSTSSYSDISATLEAGSTYAYKIRGQRQMLGVTPDTYDYTADSSTFSDALPSNSGAPSAPTTPGVSANGATATPTWIDTSTNETGFVIERSASNTFTSATTLTAGVNAISVADTPGGGTWWYRVKAVNGGQSSAWSSGVSVAVSATTDVIAAEDTYVRNGIYASTSYGSDTTMIVKGGGSGYERQAFLKFDLAAISSTGTVTDVKLKVYGKRNDTSTSGLQLDVKSVASTSWSESTLTFNTKPTVSGSAIAVINPENDTGYHTYEIDITSYVLAELAASRTTIALAILGQATTNDYLELNSKDAATHKPQLQVTVLAETPIAPTNLTVDEIIATGTTSASVALSWDDNSNNETGFTLQRRASGGNWVTIINPAANVTSFTDTYVDTDEIYDYRLAAINIGATSNYATLDSISTPPSAPSAAVVAAVSSTEALITWTASTGDIDHYLIYASINSGDYELVDSVPGTQTSARFFTLTSVTASFKVSARNAAGESVLVNVSGSEGGGSTVSVAGSVPAVPSNFTLSAAAYTDLVPLSWAATSDATGYVIEWSNGDGEWFAIDEVEGTSYNDQYPALGAQQYRIRAYRGNLDPQYSDATTVLSVHPIAPPVAWYDDNGGANERGTLSKWSVSHNDQTGIEINVVPDDVDYDGGTITIPSFANGGFEQPADNAGTVTLDEQTGLFTFVPNNDFVGTAIFRYRVTDGTAFSEWAKVAIDVTNDAPVAQQKSYDYHSHFEWVQEGSLRVDQLANTLVASDADGDTLIYEIADHPAYGAVTVSPSGDFVYTPNSSFNGVDTFSFVVSDGLSDSVPAAVRILALNDSALSRVWDGTFYFPLSGVGYGMMVLPSNGSPGSWTAEIIQQPALGTLSFAPYGQLSEGALIYQPNGYVAKDSAIIKFKSGAFETLPLTLRLINSTIPEPLYYYEPSAIAVNSQATTTWQGLSDPNITYSIISGTGYGSVTVTAGGSFTYTPPWVASGSNPAVEPFIGWTTFRYRKTDVGEAFEEFDVQLNVGADIPQSPPSTLTVKPLPLLQTAVTGAIAPTVEALESGFTTAKNMIAALLESLKLLGQRVEGVGNAADTDVLEKLSEAIGGFDAQNPDAGDGSNPIDHLATQYDQYIEQLTKLNRAAGTFLAAQWYVSQRDYDAVANINKLPTKIGSLSASKAQMDKLAGSLKDLGKGAGIAVDTANKVVTYAENAHTVLEAVQMAGGVTVLVKTGATLLVKEGLKACAKAAAKELMQNVAEGLASQVAGYMAGYVLELAGIEADSEYITYLKAGVDAYQTFAFFKAARKKVDWNGSCFAAGTNVITGFNDDGSLITTPIELIQEGDYVLSRDQHDPNDDLDPQRVTNIFRRTSDHIRTLTIRDAGGNIETIQTTDEHPFYVEGLGWTGAGDLQTGAVLDQPDGNDAVVIASERIDHPSGITVYNFEVEGDHTYFVEDGQGNRTTAVWVHNTHTCIGQKFVATYKGKPLEFDNAIETRFFRRSEVDATLIRNQFNSTRKKQFIKKIASEEASVRQLRDAGMSDEQIKNMRDLGELPNIKWQVHHKQGIELGGGNDDDNLMIFKDTDSGYHSALTGAQRNIQDELPNDGDSADRMLPMFEGVVIFDR